MGKLRTIIKKDTFTLSAFLISVFNCSARKIFSSFRDEYLIKQRSNNIIKCWFLLPHMRKTLLATLHYSTSHNAVKPQFTLACIPDDCNLTQLLTSDAAPRLLFWAPSDSMDYWSGNVLKGLCHSSPVNFV